MKIGQLLSVFLLAAVVVVNSMAPATFAAKAEPKTAEEAVRTFFESELNHDIDGMMRVAKDLRFYTTKAQKAEYESAHKIHPLEHYEIVSQKEVNASRVDFLVTAVYKDMDDMPELPYSAIKEDGQWKILIQAMEIDMSPDSPQPGKITIKSNKWENAPDSTVTPDTTSL
ncbi:hypothetical protein CBW65_03995 [Tumebacillus avium]|uniref:DUF4878 domain-containing protein n=1 Tax=Tumebacillus avium TaxID=1903704 RepID=A0A1Y0IKG1_9BACL|nr:hypothetical protein [Tumebacillus avium]ARU60316.1 hypothetical protein CBW65_03995 [Tumebacillus avium]